MARHKSKVKTSSTPGTVTVTCSSRRLTRLASWRFILEQVMVMVVMVVGRRRRRRRRRRRSRSL
jgi:hypothetical protein